MLCEPSAFDPEAFRVAVKEAALMDPQQRLLLECAAEAIQSAGCAALQGCLAHDLASFGNILKSDYSTFPDHFVASVTLFLAFGHVFGMDLAAAPPDLPLPK